jgi:uncharacterized membrane protein
VASELFVVCYPTVGAADQVMKLTRHLEAAHLLHLEDSVIVRRSEDGRLSIHRSSRRRGVETALGVVVGAVLGKMFGAPLVGGGLGAVAGAMAEDLSGNMIDDRFVHELSRHLGPNSSAAFALVRRERSDRVLSAPDKVVPELGRFGGTVLHTTLSAGDDERLQAAIDEAYHKAVGLNSTPLRPRTPKPRIVKTPSANPR